MILFKVLLFFQLAFSSEVGGKEVIRDLKKSQSNIDWRGNKTTRVKKVKRIKRPKGNLSADLVRRRKNIKAEANKAIVFPGKMKHNSTSLVRGDKLNCIIKQDVVGYVGSASPVRAEVIDGPYQGYLFVGNATMDPKTKHILIEFDTFRPASGAELHRLKATVHSVTGELGISGTHHSHYWKYFFANVLSRGAQGYAEALVEKERNVLGLYQTVPSEGNAAKRAAVEGASATGDLFLQKIRQAPEYTVVTGPIYTEIFILESPNLLSRR